jgi:hypothetical protein
MSHGDKTEASIFAREAVSGTFLTSQEGHERASSESPRVEPQVLQFGGLMRGLAHQLSSPMGALLTNLSLAQEELREALAQSPTMSDGGLARVKLAMDDLDDALNLVRRLSHLADGMKAWGRASTPSELDIREAVALIAVSTNSMLQHTTRVTYQIGAPAPSEGQQDGAHPWLVSTHFLALTFAVLEAISALGAADIGRDQTISLSAQTGNEAQIVVGIRATQATSPSVSLKHFDLSAIQSRLENTNITVQRRTRESACDEIAFYIPRLHPFLPAHT